MISSDPLLHKPKSIIAARNILYATIFLGIINVVISRMTMVEGSYSNSLGLIVPIATFVLIFILATQVGLGRKWARTVFLVLFTLGIIFFVFTIVPLFRANMVVGMLSIIQVILQILVLKFLFAQESTNWFNGIQKTTDLG
jgi:hypothetical protein